MRPKGSGGASGRFVRRVTTRYAAGVAACAIATVVPLASAANLRMQAGAYVTAGDICCNIVRGARIQDYLASGQTFSIPVLWLCSLLIISLGAVCLLMPPHGDIERTRVLASRSRASYWARRIAAVTGYVAFQLLWRLVCCVVIALVLGGSPGLGSLSADAAGLFAMEGPVAWDVGCLLRSCCLEFAVVLAMSLVAGGLAVDRERSRWSGCACGICDGVGVHRPARPDSEHADASPVRGVRGRGRAAAVARGGTVAPGRGVRPAVCQPSNYRLFYTEAVLAPCALLLNTWESGSEPRRCSKTST